MAVPLVMAEYCSICRIGPESVLPRQIGQWKHVPGQVDRVQSSLFAWLNVFLLIFVCFIILPITRLFVRSAF